MFSVAPEIRALFEDATIVPGDWYLAQRNGPARILQCRDVDTENGYIIATTMAYPYDVSECLRLRADVDPESVVLHAVEAEEVYTAWQKSFWSRK